MGGYVRAVNNARLYSIKSDKLELQSVREGGEMLHFHYRCGFVKTLTQNKLDYH